MFPRNAWYVAAFPEELTMQPRARRLLDENVVLFRTASGQAVALADSCPHRMLPLSKGRVKGEHIQCGYHGAEFSCRGKCVLVPGQDEIPERSDVKVYPLCERYGLIWIWMGEATLAAGVQPCEIYSFIEQGAWDALNGYIHIACAYELLNDNLADTTHTQFVHPTTLGNREASKLRSPDKPGGGGMRVSFDYRVLETGMEFQVKLCNTRMAPTFESGFARVHGVAAGSNLDFQLDFVFAPPANWIFSPTTMALDASADSGLRFDTMIAITPETGSSSHYFYRTCQCYAPGVRSETEYWHEQIRAAFLEDKDILEAQQENVGSRDLHDYPLVSFRGDMIGFQVRKFVRSLIDKEKVANEL